MIFKFVYVDVENVDLKSKISLGTVTELITLGSVDIKLEVIELTVVLVKVDARTGIVENRLYGEQVG